MQALHVAVQQRAGESIGDFDCGMEDSPAKRAREEATKVSNDGGDKTAPLTLAAMEKMMTTMTASMTSLRKVGTTDRRHDGYFGEID